MSALDRVLIAMLVPQPDQALATLARTMRGEGLSVREILGIVTQAHELCQEQGQQEHLFALEGLMDRLTGFCPPDQRLFPED